MKVRLSSVSRLLALALAMLAPAVVVADESSLSRVGLGNPAAGKEKSDAGRCQECHGTDGNSGDVRIPNHAGQYAGYLIKQLRDFQSGARQHQVMTVMAEDLDAADMADIASYFASRPLMKGEGGGDFPVARNLFVSGDPARDLAACVSCHGQDGKGRVANNVVYPVIAGQKRVYLHSQLTAWKLNERTNNSDAVMHKVASLLTDEEINALANYLSGL